MPPTLGGYPSCPEPRCGDPSSWAPFNDWFGAKIGRYRIVSAWPVNSYIGSHMMQIEVEVDGALYTGRGFGGGMSWQGKRKVGRK